MWLSIVGLPMENCLHTRLLTEVPMYIRLQTREGFRCGFHREVSVTGTLGRPSPCCPVEMRCWYLARRASARSSSACAAFRCLPLDAASSWTAAAVSESLYQDSE